MNQDELKKPHHASELIKDGVVEAKINEMGEVLFEVV